MPSKFYAGGVYVEEKISDADWAVLQGHWWTSICNVIGISANKNAVTIRS